MLELNNVSFNIAGKSLLNINHLQIKSGQFCGLVGANGAGKSTLLKAISGDINCSGSVFFHHQLLSQWPNNRRAKHLAVLPQHNNMSFAFTAQEVVALGLIPLRLSYAQGQAQINTIMQATQCFHLAKQSYPSLSGGEQQRVQLARVMLQLSQAEKEPLLLLDEPTSDQDLGQQHHLLQLTQDLCANQGYSVIAVIHDINQVIRYCNSCCLLAQGKLAAMGEPQQVLNVASIKQHWQYQANSARLANGAPVFV